MLTALAAATQLNRLSGPTITVTNIYIVLAPSLSIANTLDPTDTSGVGSLSNTFSMPDRGSITSILKAETIGNTIGASNASSVEEDRVLVIIRSAVEKSILGPTKMATLITNAREAAITIIIVILTDIISVTVSGTLSITNTPEAGGSFAIGSLG